MYKRQLHAQYAKACEASDRFQEAVEAYENAHDLDSVVRLHLNQLNTPEQVLILCDERNLPMERV